VDHHAHLPGVQPERGGPRRVEDLVDDLDLEEVVAGAEAADLVQAPQQRPVADRVGVGAGEHAPVLATFEVPSSAMAALDCEGGATGEDARQLTLGRQVSHRAPPHPLGHRPLQVVHQC
jgi:hypothetical protein